MIRFRLDWVVYGGMVLNCLVCPSLLLLCTFIPLWRVSFLSLSLVRWSIYWLFYENKNPFHRDQLTL